MRDYKKESEWEKNKYKRLTVKMEREKAEKFIQKLDGKEYSVWIKEKIDEYLKNEQSREDPTQ